MKDYHFENGENAEFDKTIRLDDINEKVKNIENTDAQEEDDLGDKDAFLNVFASENLGEEGTDTLQEDPLPAEEEVTRHKETPVIAEHAQEENVTVQPKEKTEETEDADDLEDADNMEEPFWNKKTIGILTGGSVAVLLVFFLLVKMFFFGSVKEKDPALQETHLMLVESVLSGDRLLLYDTETREQRTATLTEKTTLTDDKGASIGQDVPQLGDMLMVQLDEKGQEIISATYKGVEEEAITGITVDSAQKRLESEDKVFTYDEHTMFLYEGDPISPGSLDPCDALVLYGDGDHVWSVKVAQYHGYIRISHPEAVKNGTFQLDDMEAIPLEQVDRLPISAGKHTVLIQGENIENRKDTIMVQEGEETVYDVAGVQKKVGVLVVNANVTDYKLYINGTLTDTKNPAVLPFGEYDVVILKDGYAQWNQKVTLKEDTVTVSAELEKTEQEGDTYGAVSFKANVPDAEVWIDGVNMGMTPLQLDLMYGTYHVVFRKEGYTESMQTVTIENSVTNVNGNLS